MNKKVDNKTTNTWSGNEAEEDVFWFMRWDHEHVHELTDGVDVEGSSDAERWEA